MSSGGTWNTRLAAPILLVAGSLVFGLFLLEVPAFFNIVNYARILGINSEWLPANRVADPELLHINRPHLHLTGAARGGNILLQYRIPESAATQYHWDVSYDSHGFRNASEMTRASIAVLGDSFVEGMTIPEPELMTSILAKRTNRVVANLGQSGYGPQQELAVLKRYGIPLRPRTVLWMFYEGNDLSDLEQYDRSIHHPAGVWTQISDRSFTRNALARIYHLVTPPGIRVSGVVRTPRGESAVYYFDKQSAFSAAHLTPAHDNDLDRLRQIFANAEGLCAANGCHLVVVFVPTAFRVLRPFCSFPAESECGRWTLNDLPERIGRAAHSASGEIGYLDLTPELTEAVSRGGAPYYTDDAHWTADGQRAAAEAIGGFIDRIAAR